VGVLIVILTLTTLGTVLAVVVKKRGYKKATENTVAITNRIGFRVVGEVTAPEGLAKAAAAIEEVLDARFPDWASKIELVIEWHPHGTILVGQFIRTGFQLRESGQAVYLPEPEMKDGVPSYPAGLEKKYARVGGTIRIDKLWPWSRPRYTAMIVDRRLGETPREFLLSGLTDKDSGRPRRDAGGAPLFYEICKRIVLMGLQGVKADRLAVVLAADKLYDTMEAEMQAAYKKV